jgi:hypothetical protein
VSVEPHPVGGGGWISGACTTTGVAPAPEFSVSFLVHEVRRLLAESGIPTNLTDGQLHTATIAAGDLLRAVGVKPASAPERRA